MALPKEVAVVLQNGKSSVFQYYLFRSLQFTEIASKVNYQQRNAINASEMEVTLELVHD